MPWLDDTERPVRVLTRTIRHVKPRPENRSGHRIIRNIFSESACCGSVVSNPPPGCEPGAKIHEQEQTAPSEDSAAFRDAMLVLQLQAYRSITKYSEIRYATKRKRQTACFLSGSMLAVGVIRELNADLL